MQHSCWNDGGVHSRGNRQCAPGKRYSKLAQSQQRMTPTRKEFPSLQGEGGGRGGAAAAVERSLDARGHSGCTSHGTGSDEGRAPTEMDCGGTKNRMNEAARRK